MKLVLPLAFVALACSCTPIPDSERPIRNQGDVDRYNATVSSEGEKLVCERERVLGSNLPQFVCMTVNQRERLAEAAVDTLRNMRDAMPTSE